MPALRVLDCCPVHDPDVSVVTLNLLEKMIALCVAGQLHKVGT